MLFWEVYMTTREKIIEVSLKLFAEHGFTGVSVRSIAKEVGVRESALYKHFKNKQDILNQIIIEMKDRIHQAYMEQGVPEVISDDIAKGYRELSKDQFKEIAWNIFCLFTKDRMVSNYRKLLMKEMLGNKQIANLYADAFLTGVLEKQGKTFEALIKDGMFHKEDAQIVALQFYGAIFLLFQQYDCHPEQEEIIKNMLEKHVEAFGRNYGNKN